MTVVVTAPGDWRLPGYKVFLAGAIDLGQGVDWQADAIAALAGRPGLVLLNPRRAGFDPGPAGRGSPMQDEQIRWELAALDAVDRILMWFPAGAQAPISLLETGLHLRSGRVLLGVEPGYARQRNLELTAEHYGVPVYHSLGELIARVPAP